MADLGDPTWPLAEFTGQPAAVRDSDSVVSAILALPSLPGLPGFSCLGDLTLVPFSLASPGLVFLSPGLNRQQPAAFLDSYGAVSGPGSWPRSVWSPRVAWVLDR